ncbi:MAG: outer membrane beta-barrel protein [Desulfobacter sp.]
MYLKTVGIISFFVAVFTANAVGGESKMDFSSIWQGQYVGIAAGASYSKADPDVMLQQTTYFNSQDSDQLNPLASENLDQTDFSGGLLWGFAFQKDHFVFGIEADVSMADFEEEYSTGDISYTSLPTRDFSITTRVKSDWAASLRLRLGYAWKDSLFFASAGPSWTRFDYRFIFTDGLPESADVDKDEVTQGWTAGVGYEKKLGKAWSMRTEWLYAYYGDIIDTDSFLSTNSADGFTHDLDYETHSFRLCIIRSF